MLVPVVVVALAAAACGTASSDGQPAVPLATATPDEPAQAEDTGTLEILSQFPTKILVDGKPAGTTPIDAYKVTPGRHDVTFVDETGNRTMTVDVAPGGGQTIKSDRPPSMTQKPQPPPPR
jgi:hypothetical protein